MYLAISAITQLFLLLLVAGAGYIAYRYWLQRAEEKLRNNPPERRIIEVSLPVGTDNSPSDMARFYRKIASAALGDKKARAHGMRQIDFVYLIDVPAEGAMPRLRCRIYADPDQMDAVKKGLKASFREAIDLLEIKEDELQDIAAQLRPQPSAEDPAEMQALPPGAMGELPEGVPEDFPGSIVDPRDLNPEDFIPTDLAPDEPIPPAPAEPIPPAPASPEPRGLMEEDLDPIEIFPQAFNRQEEQIYEAEDTEDPGPEKPTF